MILRDLIDKSLDTFEREQTFFQFFRAYTLCLMYMKYTMNLPVEAFKDYKIIIVLKKYYCGALLESIFLTRKNENESEESYNKRVEQNYLALRKKSYSVLMDKVLENFKSIYQVLGILAYKKQQETKTKLDNYDTWMVRDYA